MDDIRWFAVNRYGTLPVPALEGAGLTIALGGEAPARLAVAVDSPRAVAAFEYAARHRVPLLFYLWDLPPWRLGTGRPDPTFLLGGRVRRIWRPWGGYRERAGYYSRIHFVARRAAEVWCPSEATRGDIRARFGIDAHRVPFCYDSHRFGPAGHREARSAEAISLLSISRLTPQKDHATLIRAAARLSPKPRVRIIGQGAEADPLRRLAADLDVPLDLPGAWAGDDEIVGAYREASVVVAPSRFEGFGLTPIEGVAMGVPVIASDIPPHREFLGNRVRWFPPGDDEALAEQIGDALLAPRPAPEPLSDLTIEQCAARFLPGLERLLGGRR
ncbi:MAG: glycosyltransferase [Gemmatimonadales bacterium]|nr:glycosyltransferase [Gemmatimonadales bacterium]